MGEKGNKILAGIVFIGLLSVLGAFFVDHQMGESCVFNISSNCPAMLGTIGETVHLLKTFGSYIGGVAALPFALFLAASLGIVHLARDATLARVSRSITAVRERVNDIPSARSVLLFTIALHNKRAPRPALATRGA